MAARPTAAPAEPRRDMYDFVTYTTLCAGYLLGVIAAEHLTLGGFAVVTAVHLAWLLLFRMLMRCDTPSLPLLVAMFVVACLGILEVRVGMGFDWLLPILTLGAICSMLTIRASLIFGGLLLLAFIGVVVLVDNAHLVQVSQDLTAIIPAFVFVYAFTFLARQQIAQRARAEQLVADLEASQAKLQTAHTQLQHYAAQVEELTITRERNHIAREIHDTLGHYLTILALQLETAAQMEARGDARLRGEIAEARRVATECLAAVRHSVAALHPTEPTGVSLIAALERLVGEFTAASPHTEVTLDVDGPAQGLPPAARVALFRAAQEALTNTRKHASATKVLLRLRVESDHAELAIIDNGQGGTPGDHASGFGLQGMRERVALLGGTMMAQPAPEQGWRVEVYLPLVAIREATANVMEGAHT
jgi:signal transduction histidine kinase